MPFDLLPQHRIELPKVQFYHPDPRLMETALRSQALRNQMILNSLDNVLKAADPATIAQRRLEMAKAHLAEQELPIQQQEMMMDYMYRRTHGGLAMPTTYAEMNQMANWQQRQFENQNWYDATHPTGPRTGGGQGDIGNYGVKTPTSQQVAPVLDLGRQQLNRSLDRINLGLGFGGYGIDHSNTQVTGTGEQATPMAGTPVNPNAPPPLLARPEETGLGGDWRIPSTASATIPAPEGAGELQLPPELPVISGQGEIPTVGGWGHGATAYQQQYSDEEAV
jgi:hypothetical protein